MYIIYAGHPDHLDHLDHLEHLVYLDHLDHCTMLPLLTWMLQWSKFPMYLGLLLQEHIIQN